MIGGSIVEVAVGALVRADGAVLVMERLPGTPYAGRWEFPGGKFEPGEDADAALERELREELGITPDEARPLMRIRHDYPERKVRLHCIKVTAWRGDIVAREGHALHWGRPDALHALAMLAADRPLIAALELPDRYAITRDAASPALLADIERLIGRGHTLIQFRAPSLGAGFEPVAQQAIDRCRARGVTLLVNTTPSIARALDADGVHLNSRELMALAARPLPADRWVAASCHDRAELLHAVRVGCDFAVLGPVRPTRSHPDAPPLGWERFAGLVDCAGLPVFALGGLTVADRGRAWRAHGQGVAGITGL